MNKRTKAELETDNAELRRRVEMLEAVVQRLVATPAPQIVPMPCPGPHYPPPAVQPSIFDPFLGTLTCLPPSNNAGCAAPLMLGDVWVGETRGSIGTH